MAMNQELCRINKWNNVSTLTMLEGKLSLESHSVDTIFALDVLEHVDDLPTLLLEFVRILKPGGRLIVSSPTENAIYKFVRRFGGPGYQGEFHLRAAKEVEFDLSKDFRLKLRSRVFPILTFFRIVEGTRE